MSNNKRQTPQKSTSERPKYRRYDYKTRLRLIEMVESENRSMTSSAKELKICQTTARLIMSTWRAEQRVFEKKSEREKRIKKEKKKKRQEKLKQQNEAKKSKPKKAKIQEKEESLPKARPEAPLSEPVGPQQAQNQAIPLFQQPDPHIEPMGYIVHWNNYPVLMVVYPQPPLFRVMPNSE